MLKKLNARSNVLIRITQKLLLLVFAILKFISADAFSVTYDVIESSDYGEARDFYEIAISSTVEGISPDYYVSALFINGEYYGNLFAVDSLEDCDFTSEEYIIEEYFYPCDTLRLTMTLNTIGYGHPDNVVASTHSEDFVFSCHNIWGGDCEIDSKDFYDHFVKPLNLVKIIGSLEITASDLDNVDALASLEEVEENVSIYSSSLENLNGLSGLQTIGWDFYYDGSINNNISDLSCLNNLETVGFIEIYEMDSLDGSSFMLNNCTIDWFNLNNIGKIQNLQFFGSGNQIGSISISNCADLYALTGIENITSLVSSLEIYYNSNLHDYCPLKTMINNSAVDTNDFDIYYNAYNPSIQDILYGKCNDQIACAYSDVDSLHYAFDAVTYLCGEGLIDDDGACEPDSAITRAALAKLACLSINLRDYAVADTFPSPFQDLQDTSTWFYTYAKNLSYLEYQDGIAPFDKTYFNFYASKHISRAHALKVLLETWNIPLQTGTGLPYTDTPTTHDAYKYIYTAYQLGIIEDNTSNIFGPDADVYRGEVFVFLYKMMHTLALTPPVPTTADFFIPGNYTPETFATYNSMHSGNFNFFTKTSFSISSIGLPLNFEHTFNSYLAEMPEALTPLRPFGKAWSHPYNSFIMEIEGDVENPDDYRVVIALPGGGFNVYCLENEDYICETLGVYNTLEKTSSDQFTITTKKQIVYTYQKPSGTAASFPYVLASVTDRNGNTLTINYEDSSYRTGFKRIANIVGTAGRTLTFTYHDNTDLISSVSDPLGRAISYDYDTYNVELESPRLTSFVDGSGNCSYYNYGTTSEDEFLLLSIQLPKGNIITNTYEQKKLVSTQTNGNQPSTFNYERNFGGSSATYSTTLSTDPEGRETLTQFNKNGNPEQIHSETSDIDITYNAIQTSKSENLTVNSKSTAYTYDTNGNVLTMSLPMGVTHRFAYNAFNDPISYTDPRGKEFTYQYDGNGNLVQYTTPRGSTTYTRNSNGTIASITNPAGITLNYGYDSYGNQTSTSAPEGIATSATYDIASRITSFTNPRGYSISYAYDNNDNLLTETFGGLTTAYAYDKNDNLTAITNAKGGVTTMEYDFQDDFLIEIEFGGNTDSYTYLDDGRLDTHITPNNDTFSNTYDSKGRLQSYGTGSDEISYTYDDYNNIISVTNTSGTIEFEYDDLGRLILTRDFWDNEVSYSYDLAGNITDIIYPGDKTVTYSYCDDNLLQSVTDWNSQTTSYTYRDDGLLTQTIYPNGTNCTYTYDNAGRMTGMSWEKSDETVICGYTFTLDATGNHLTETKTEPYSNSVLTSQSNSFTYNSSNQIDSDGTTSYTFDSNGNCLSKGSRTYSFNKFDQLAAIGGDLDLQYTYDGNGNRRQAVNNSVVSRYILDLQDMSNVLIETDGTNTPVFYYVYGLGLISRIDVSGNYNYYHYDFRGSAIAMTDNSENITHRYQYGDFGEVLQKQETNFNPFRYVGKYGIMFEDSSLYYMRARYYDPDIGRFISEDPVWSTNLYPYVDNNPAINIDPNGTNIFSLYNTYRSFLTLNKDDSWRRMTYNTFKVGKETVSEIKGLGELSKIATKQASLKSMAKSSKGCIYASLAFGTIDRGITMYDSSREGEFDPIMIPKMIGATALDGLISYIPVLGAATAAYETKTGKNPSDLIFDRAEDLGNWLGGKIYDWTH